MKIVSNNILAKCNVNKKNPLTAEMENKVVLNKMRKEFQDKILVMMTKLNRNKAIVI